MLNYSEYVKGLNFAEYEKTNAFCYELIMRNEECQKCLKQLYRVTQNLLNGMITYNQSFKNEFQSDKDLENYVVQRWQIDNEVSRLKNYRSNFFKEISNTLFVLKAAVSDKKWKHIFLNYLQKQSILNKHPYLEHVLNEDMEIDEDLLDILIAAVGQVVMQDRYPELIVEDNVDPNSPIEMQLGMYCFQLDLLLNKLMIKNNKDIESIIEKKKQIMIQEYEEVYQRYRRTRRMIERWAGMRQTIEAYLAKEFFIDFSQNLYLDYPFFSSRMQKELNYFYGKEVQQLYKDIAKDTLPGGVKTNEYEISYQDVQLKINEIFSVDSKAIESIDSIYTIESLHEVIDQNTSEYIFRRTRVEPVFSRPKLFSERFRDIELNFNPNLPKKELVSQFEAIIEAYQTDQLKNQSIYEVLEENFDVWNDTVYREKRLHTKQTDKLDAKKISTLVNASQDLLYIYDTNKDGVAHTVKSYPTNLSERTISSHLNFAKFLIEEKGYKLLLTSNI